MHLGQLLCLRHRRKGPPSPRGSSWMAIVQKWRQPLIQNDYPCMPYKGCLLLSIYSYKSQWLFFHNKLKWWGFRKDETCKMP